MAVFDWNQLKQIKQKYDLRRTKVTNIKPYFCCEDYAGFLLTITN